MECEAVKTKALAEEHVVFALAVSNVADDRVTHVLEVQADLVSPSRFRPRLKEPIPLEGAEQGEVRHGRDSLGPVIASECMFDAIEGRIFASTESEISLFDASRLELLAESRSDLRSSGDQQGSARPAVETMYRIDPFAHLIAETLQERRSFDSTSAMHGKPARLVDDEQIFVSVEDLDRIIPLLLGRSAGEVSSVDVFGEQVLERLFSLATFENTERASDRFNRCEAARLRFMAESPGGGPSLGKEYALHFSEPREAACGAGSLAPVAVGDDECDWPWILADELRGQSRSPFARVEEQEATIFAAEVGKVGATVASPVNVKLRVRKGSESERRGSSCLFPLATMHDDDDLGARLEARNELAHATRLVHTAASAADGVFWSVSHGW